MIKLISVLFIALSLFSCASMTTITTGEAVKAGEANYYVAWAPITAPFLGVTCHKITDSYAAFLLVASK